VTVVLLHAFPLDERMWDGQRAAVPDAVTPRLYGRGNTMDAWAESLAAEIDEDVVLVGASMGGYCALAFARRYAERVRALLLVGSRPDADSDERRAGRAKTIELIRSAGAEGLWQDMVPKLFADERNADEHLLYRDTDGLVAAVEAIRDRDDSTAVARELDGRARFVVGEHDPFVSPEELRAFDVREIPGAGHLVNLERPDEFNSLLMEFVSSV
jgi:pimeloyl-ACP methyl ester carboxylesterase